MMGLGLGGNFAVAQDVAVEKKAVAAEASNDAEDALEAEYKKIKDTVMQTGKDFMKKVAAEKDKDKQRDMYLNQRPDHSAQMEQLMKLADAHPSSEKTLNALIWGQRVFKPEQRVAAKKILMDRHIHNDKFESVVNGLARSRNEPTATFEKIKATSNNPRVQHAASYVIAQRFIEEKDTREDGIAMLKQLLAVPDIDKINPRLVKSAKEKLFVAENLSVGLVAPDIVGTDHAGVEFKLSDYRGKVVVLDFWGHW